MDDKECEKCRCNKYCGLVNTCEMTKEVYQTGANDALEKISNTIEAMIYKKTDEYGADIVEMYAEIVDDLQEFIVQELKKGE